MTTTEALPNNRIPTTDTTSSDVEAFYSSLREPEPSAFPPRVHWWPTPSEEPQRSLLETLLCLLRLSPGRGPLLKRLGTPEESTAALLALQELATRVTSWDYEIEQLHELPGVFAFRRDRRVIFQDAIDITPGNLPRKKHGLLFLETPEVPGDDE
jgi:hypothetical protein